jgi:hypothetical protein
MLNIITRVKAATISGLLILLAACVYVPEKSAHQVDAEQCEMISEKLTLQLKKYKLSVKCGISPADLMGCMLVGGIITSASAVVSGSLVLVGNTVHWAEHKMSCPEVQQGMYKNKAAADI